MLSLLLVVSESYQVLNPLFPHFISESHQARDSYTIQDELAQEYEKFLLPSLTIANHDQSSHLIQDSDKEKAELREMLKEANKTIQTLRTVIDLIPSRLSQNSLHPSL